MLLDESFQILRGEADAPANPQKRNFPVGDPTAHNALADTVLLSCLPHRQEAFGWFYGCHFHMTEFSDGIV